MKYTHFRNIKMEKEYNARGEKVYTTAINRENAKTEKEKKNTIKIKQTR